MHIETRTLTFREQYLNTLLFEKPDRVPLFPGEAREATQRAWREQGLPQEIGYYEAMLQELRLPSMKFSLDRLPISFAMLPVFEEKVIEHKDGHFLVQDWSGAIVEISDEYDFTYLRWPSKSIVTRKWHKFPVESRSDWEQIRERYLVDTPGRFPEHFAEFSRSLDDRENAVYVHVDGPFYQLRSWCGFENLCMLLIDDPEFVQEMIDFWTEFISQALSRTSEHITLDRVCVSEDIAYKAHSMVSQDMVRTFFMPTYERWASEVRAAGCPVFDIDSDGYVEELLPMWIEAGFNVCHPMEVAADNDIVAYRKRFGKKMAYVGGVDKRAMAAGGKAIEDEVRRLTPLIKEGGYIPSCDHQVPADVSWSDYLYYSRLLAEACGWL
ncbi:MAG: hypothetical protein HYX78_07355 [Armatimonadetes bacterium]|nr:hypothetical protein [Armatimonadota bacterium]